MKKTSFMFLFSLALGMFAFPGVSQATSYCPVSINPTYIAKYQGVSSESDLCKAMNYLAGRGVMTQFGISSMGDGYLRSGDFTNRAQAIAVVLNAFDPDSVNVSVGSPVYGNQLGFRDTPSYETQWWYGFALRGKQLGFIKGYEDGTFRGGNDVTRAEFVKMFLAASPHYSDVQSYNQYSSSYHFNDVNYLDQWYVRYALFVASHGDMLDAFRNRRCPSGSFCPNLPITTDEMALFMYYYHQWSGKTLGFKDGGRISPTPSPSPNPTFTAPVPIAPTNGAIYDTSMNSRTIYFNWNSMGATSYRFNMRASTSNSYFVDQVVYTNNSSYSFTGLLNNPNYNGLRYYWKVTAYDKNGRTLSSNENYFQFQAPASTLGTPFLQSPANNSHFFNSNFNGNTNLLLNWAPATSAVKYDVMLRFGGSSTYEKIYTTNNTSYFVPSSALPALNGPGYVIIHWKVRAYDASNNFKDSVEWVLQNNWQNGGGISAPVLSSPANNSVFNNPCWGGSLTFDWLPVSGAVKYILYVENWNIAIGGETSGTDYTIDTKLTPLDNGNRVWWVRAVDANGNFYDSNKWQVNVNNQVCLQ